MSQVPKAVLAMVLSLALPSIALAQDSWALKTECPEWLGGQGGGVANGKLYAWGDWFVLGYPAPTVPYEYDPVTNAWSAKVGALPTGKTTYWSACVSLDNRIYVTGGFNWDGTDAGSAINASLTVYDPAADTWASRAPMAAARITHAAVALNGRILVIGGQGEGTALSSVEEYNPATNSWRARKELPAALAHLYAGEAFGKAYVAGGIGATPSAATYEYDPGADSWTRRADLPGGYPDYGNYGGSCVSLGSSLFCFGGTDSDLSYSKNNFEYRPARDIWVTRASPVAAHYMGVSGAINGKIYAFGFESYLLYIYYMLPFSAINQLQEYTPPVYASIPPAPPSGLVQKSPDGTPVAEGAWYGEETILLEAGVADDDGASQLVRLDVEVRAGGQPFTGQPNFFGTWKAPGTCAVQVAIPGGGDFAWRARSMDEFGKASSWVDFGSGDPDFRRDLEPPSVPQIVLPGEGFVSPTAATLVEWTASDDNSGLGVTYEVQLSNDPLFGTLIASREVDGTSDSFTLPVPSILNYVRVRAKDAVSNISGWSEPVSFKRKAPASNPSGGDDSSSGGCGASASAQGGPIGLVAALLSLAFARRNRG